MSEYQEKHEVRVDLNEKIKERLRFPSIILLSLKKKTFLWQRQLRYKVYTGSEEGGGEEMGGTILFLKKFKIPQSCGKT